MHVEEQKKKEVAEEESKRKKAKADADEAARQAGEDKKDEKATGEDKKDDKKSDEDKKDSLEDYWTKHAEQTVVSTIKSIQNSVVRDLSLLKWRKKDFGTQASTRHDHIPHQL